LGSHDDEAAKEVHLIDFSLEGGFDRSGCSGALKGDEDYASCQAADGKVDVKAPAPAEVISE
jgi:hypothetical protein